MDSAIGFPNTYPLYSDLSGPGCSNIGQGYPPDKSQSRVGKSVLGEQIALSSGQWFIQPPGVNNVIHILNN